MLSLFCLWTVLGALVIQVLVWLDIFETYDKWVQIVLIACGLVGWLIIADKAMTGKWEEDE